MKLSRDPALWEKLERLVLEWRDAGADGPARMRLNLEITQAMLELFRDPEDMEALGIFWEQDLRRYDPGKGSFRGFVISRLKHRRQDLEHEDTGARRVTGEDGRQCWEGNASLDAPAGEDGGTWGDRQASSASGAGEEDLEAEAAVQELIALILLLPRRLSGQARNPARINYYRMFFTDGMVDALNRMGAGPCLCHERDLFAAMKVPFLDFFMERRCRSVEEILASGVKDYGRMVAGRPMEPPDQPLPNDVYMTYLNQEEGAAIRSASTITNQRMAYYAFLREHLC